MLCAERLRGDSGASRERFCRSPLGIYASVMSVERLRAELAEAERELREHMASWEYAFAMAGGANGGREHPTHWATRARTEELVSRRRALAARLAEYEPSGGS
jgi:hypothetical protein